MSLAKDRRAMKELKDGELLEKKLRENEENGELPFRTGMENKAVQRPTEVAVRCTGCGCKLQSESPDKLGYIPPGLGSKPKPVSKRDYSALFTSAEDFFIDEETAKIILKAKEEDGTLKKEREKENRKEQEKFRQLEEEERLKDSDEQAYILAKLKREKEMRAEEEKEKRRRIEDEKFERFKREINSAVAGIQATTIKPKDKIPKAKICQRCFNLKYHGKVVPIKVPMDSFREKLSNLGKMRQNIIVFKMVDVFDFHGSFIDNFRDIVGRNNVILLVNKMDLLPSDVSQERVSDWIRTEARERGLTNLRGVHLVSSKSFSIKSLIRELDNIAEDQDVFILGASNVGKSTLMNQIMKFHDITANEATTSLVPGTTLNTISFKVPKGPTVYDTPGMHNPHQLISRLSPKELLKVIPQTRIKPQIWSLNPGNTIFLGGLARLDYIEGPPIYFTLFISKNLPVHVTRTKNAERVYSKHLGTLLYPPFPEERGKIPGEIEPLTPLHKAASHEIKGTGFKQATADIVFSGLGWVSITGPYDTYKIDTYVPSGIHVFERRPLLPYETPSETKRDLRIHKHKKPRPNKKRILARQSEKEKQAEGGSNESTRSTESDEQVERPLTFGNMEIPKNE